MAVPKRRKTKSRRDNRRMHIFIKNAGLTTCQKCGKPVLGHTVCKNCGYYKKVEVIDVMKKLTKKEKKAKKKEIDVKDAEKQKDKPVTMEGLSK